MIYILSKQVFCYMQRLWTNSRCNRLFCNLKKNCVSLLYYNFNYFDVAAVAGRSDKIFRVVNVSLRTEACRQSSDLQLEIVRGFPVESPSDVRLEPILKLICTFEPFKPKSLESAVWCS